MTLERPFEPVLGADVGGLVRRGAVAVDAGDVDDPAEAAVVHPGQQPAGEPERRLEHQPVDQPEPLGLEVLERGDVLDAGGVDEDVGVDLEGVDRVAVGEVDPGVVAADGGRHLGGLLLVAVEHRDLGAELGQPRGHGRADAAGTTGHQGTATGERGRGVGLWHAAHARCAPPVATCSRRTQSSGQRVGGGADSTGPRNSLAAGFGWVVRSAPIGPDLGDQQLLDHFHRQIRLGRREDEPTPGIVQDTDGPVVRRYPSTPARRTAWSSAPGVSATTPATGSPARSTSSPVGTRRWSGRPTPTTSPRTSPTG